MSFKIYNEVFNEPYKYEKIKAYGKNKSFVFKIKKSDFIQVDLIGSYGELEIMFQRQQNKEEDQTSTDKMKKQGDAFRVFATVIDILEKNLSFLKEYDSVMFTARAKDKGRVKLYNVLAKKLQKILKYKTLRIEKTPLEILYFIEND